MGARLKRGLACAALALAGCGDGGGVPPAEVVVLPCTPRPPIADFVRAEGGALTLGGAPFRAMGGNLYYLQQLFAYGETNAALAAPALAALDAAACLSMNVVRTLGFNDGQDPSSIRLAPGQYEEAGLRGLDRAVAEARARGIRLVLTLTNNWNDYGGLEAYARWAGRAHDDFFGDATMMGYWTDYAATLLARVNPLTGVAYRDEPAILGWEVANELRCRACRGSTRYVDTVRALAAHLRSLGARQLILDGGEGFDDVPSAYAGLSTTQPVSGAEGASFSKLAAAPELDAVSYHLYPESWGLTRASDGPAWIAAHERIARQAGKAAYLGEFGSDPGFAGDLDRRDFVRAPRYDAWLRSLFEANTGQAALLWQVIPASRRDDADDGYGVVYGEDHRTVRALADWASRVAPIAAP